MSSATEIADWACYDQLGLTTLIIPGSVEIIGRYAFGDCETLVNLTLNEGVKIIKENAFEDTSIAEVTFPKSIKKIEDDALDSSTIKKVVFLGDVPEIGEIFAQISIDAYYPDGNETWKNNLKLYGGFLKWKPFDASAVEPDPTEPTPTEPNPTEPDFIKPSATEPDPTEPVDDGKKAGDIRWTDIGIITILVLLGGGAAWYFFVYKRR